ncbi:MAG: DUF1684 domain-containing protein [Ignavibacteria bacterium]|nr:DUF1684 domain-containing protein [Ignavibacteria bacterium]
MNILFLKKNRGARFAVFASLALSLAAGAAAVTGCGGKERGDEHAGAVADSSDLYSLYLTKDRKEKDLSFLRDDGSPLLPDQKEQFQGLKYFPPDKSYAFETVLHRLSAPATMIMATSKDRPREMLHIGWLPFMRSGTEYRLQVYMPKDTSEDKYWFIPFTDAGSGTDTYAGGRFIDIEKPASDSVFLDFNYAYNPYCAYNERYDCPIPPKENHLPFAVKAGEKLFRPASH